MKLNNIKRMGLCAGIVLSVCSLTVYADEDHIEKALKHAKEAGKAGDAKTIAEHAELARTHAKTADEHLDAGISSLDNAIAQGKQGDAAKAKQSVEEAITHLKKAED
ncbi:MAG: small metal-binding protein SmbP [Methylobacter sp.]